jgi:hypothetical protein
MLKPRGKGTQKHPITIQEYDDGERPVIDGAGEEAGILLRSVDGYIIKNLEITNNSTNYTKA